MKFDLLYINNTVKLYRKILRTNAGLSSGKPREIPRDGCQRNRHGMPLYEVGSMKQEG
jgi:hypothetical protein